MSSALPIKQVDWLLARTIAGTVLVVLAVLVGFDVMLALVEEFDDLGDGDYNLFSAIIYVAYTIPRRIHTLFGPSALVGCLVGLGLLAGHGELTAMRAAGLAKRRIALSATATIAMLTVAVMVIGETVAPEGERWAQQLSVQTKHRDYALSQDSGMWARDGDTIVNAKRAFVNADRELELVDMRLYGFDRNGRMNALTHAAGAVYRGDAWQLTDVRRFSLGDEQVTSSQSTTDHWQSSLDPNVLSLGAIRPHYLGMAGLLDNYRYHRANQLNTQAIESAFWSRLFGPFATIALVFAITPFAFGTLRSGGFGKRVFIGVVIAVAFHFTQRALINLADVYGYSLPLINFAPVLLLGLAGWLYYRFNP